ncbi:addiction module protein [Turneriella parva]|uniref:Addiction module component CHP02574 family protein n=1 Tax=Turneriella parva (strain ATCC BAA-1111 / DSM 21527 / NCTC 11395 / H) TaxID=869212 RepID=I4B9Y4_TURPD|nr:addiction module protein [Turneriella parva]AFM14091.1 Putative addiction module component CHP02574 family protein [Turneriella parva DSM 21527]
MGIEQAIAMIKSQDLSTEAAILDDIWFDLQQKVMNSPIPAEHQLILDERLDKIEAGQAIFTDWKTLKSKLLNAKAH